MTPKSPGCRVWRATRPHALRNPIGPPHAALESSVHAPNILKTPNTLFTSDFFFEKIVLVPLVLVRFYGGRCILENWGYWLYALKGNAIVRIFVLIGTRIESGNRDGTDNQSGGR